MTFYLDEPAQVEPDDDEIRSYYLPEKTARGVLYGSCMVCGTATRHEHHHSATETPDERAAAALVHETCDPCWEWFATLTAQLDPKLIRPTK